MKLIVVTMLSIMVTMTDKGMALLLLGSLTVCAIADLIDQMRIDFITWRIRRKWRVRLSQKKIDRADLPR